ncbi:MAG: CBS domain-containing protein [Bacteroidota bacterium]|jgi:CBS domain-containing protein|nr:CBS domain-containing protein [Bacteroidota bacterium]
MIAKELINQMIPPLKLKDDGQKALTWMEELRTNQLPIVDNGNFMGLISEEIVFSSNNLKKPMASYELFGDQCFVNENQHFYDVVKLASDFEVQVVAVLDDEKKFLGVITVEDTLAAFAQTLGVQNPGGIIIISLRQIDYSLAEISRLIESDNAKILSSCINNDLLDPDKIKLTLKINRTDLSRIVATLDRFGYKIIGKFQQIEAISNERERLDILMRYLDI